MPILSFQNIYSELQTNLKTEQHKTENLTVADSLSCNPLMILIFQDTGLTQLFKHDNICKVPSTSVNLVMVTTEGMIE